MRLTLPGEHSSIHHSIPPGTFYVQVLRAHSLSLHDHKANGGSSDIQNDSNGSNRGSKSRGVYVRCVIDEGTHIERTMDGLDINKDSKSDEATKSNGSFSSKRKFGVVLRVSNSLV